MEALGSEEYLATAIDLVFIDIGLHIKVTPTTFGLKCINLPKCTKLCSTGYSEVADKSFGLLTKNYPMHWQIRGLKDRKSGNIWVVHSNP